MFLIQTLIDRYSLKVGINVIELLDLHVDISPDTFCTPHYGEQAPRQFYIAVIHVTALSYLGTVNPSVIGGTNMAAVRICKMGEN